MSVPKSKRGQSSMQYVQTAFDIYKEAMRLTVKIPKRYTFYISQDIVKSAADAFCFCKTANSIFPGKNGDGSYNQHEVQMRRDNLINARCKYQVLVSQVEIAREFVDSVDLTKNIMRLMTLVSDELALIQGVMTNDLKRFSLTER